MNKKDIKHILNQMRTNENEYIVNRILGRLDLMDEVTLQDKIKLVGETKEEVMEFFEKKISKRLDNNLEEQKPINGMFSYGVSADCIHLHLPIDLHQIIQEKGISRTIDIVNLNLLDAIDRIATLKKDGYYKFQGKDSIYMISTILRGRELKFLDGLDFETAIYKKEQLNMEEFVRNNPEAMLAIHIFGKGQNVGVARIKFDIILSKEWQVKKQTLIKTFEEKGITVEDNESIEK